MTASKKRPWVAYALMFIPAALLTWLPHEFAHWQMGEALGYDMWMSLNRGGLEGGGAYDSALDRSLVDAAGPLITYILAIAALALIRTTRSLLLYPFLFLQFYMRAVALGISVVSQPNDEARISLEFGLPLWLLPGIAVTLLLALTCVIGFCSFYRIACINKVNKINPLYYPAIFYIKAGYHPNFKHFSLPVLF